MTRIPRIVETLSKLVVRLISMALVTLGMGTALPDGAQLFMPVLAADSEVRAVHLPLVQNAPKSTAGPTEEPTVGPTVEPTVKPTTGPTPQPPQASAFFADRQWRTSSASLATDAQGGMHMAYVYYHGLAENVPNAGVYQFCAGACDKPEHWQMVRLGQEVNEIQLALTPQGQPRILYRTPTANNGWAFVYGACNTQCTDPNQWTLTQVATNEGMAPIEINNDDLPQRYFALDNAGRPRFVYGDRKGTHYGTFYRFCDTDCTDASNWSETRINKDNGGVGPYRDEDFFYPALTFSPTGQPRVVTDGVTMQDEFFLYYLACDSGCDQAQNWVNTPIFPRGSGFEFSYDVEINANGQPRVAIYEAAYLGGGGNVLSYAWCNHACTEAGNWQRHPLGLAVLEGQEPDLELDGAGRPHIAYSLYKDGGLGYSTCSSACEGTGAKWQHKVLDSRTALHNDSTVPLPLICSNGLWDGLTPSLALDGSGAPHIAYDATYYGRCHYVGEDKWEPWSEMNLVWRAVRVYLTGDGATPGEPTVTPEPGTATVTPTQTATATPSPTVSVTPTPPLPPRQGTGLFPESTWRTSSSDIAVDSANGQHLAFVYTETLWPPDPDGDTNPTSAVYRYCASACDQAQSWSSVTLGEAVSEVQVAVNPDGKPRLLLLVRAEMGGAPADRYVYAECNQTCTNSANWQLTPLVTVPNDLSWRWIDAPTNWIVSAREVQPRRYFALDPMGRPRFIYYHYNMEADPDGVGAYYAACDATCATAGNWTHTRLTVVFDFGGALETEVLEHPVLTFAPDGGPRILGAFGFSNVRELYYLACDHTCDVATNWTKTWVGNHDDANGEFDLAIDQNGLPYIVISYGWEDGLRYGWCDADCTDWMSWQTVWGPLLEVQHPDLELDAQGRPRLLYRMTEYDDTGNNPDDGLHLLHCTGQCRTAEATWTSNRVESGLHHAAEWPASLPPACAGGKWYPLVPTLVLANNDMAYAGADVAYIANCVYNEATEAWEIGGKYEYNTVWRAARWVVFPAP